ncbi:RloB family protein [Sporosarcina sp. A2]|uniref:RloB family protein n=1 Tax=Sporosarcina sp. A2 TaxID=3393449 RepID=UPI003D794CBD
MALPSRSKRKIDVKRDIYIFTEGKETEVHYFNALKQKLRVPTLKIRVKGVGNSGTSLVDYAIQKTKNENKSKIMVWVVFDKDDLTTIEIEKSQKIAKQNSVNIAFSNTSFELWLLMHYESIVKGNTYDKKIIFRNLSRNLGISDFNKHKNDVNLIQSIAEKVSIALNNNLLLIEHSNSIFHSPYTNMHNLIQQLK